RSRETIDAAAAGIGRDTVPIVADVSHVEGAAGFVRDAVGALGGVDILVLNAGGPPAGDFAHTTVEQYLEAFELNCRGAIAMCYEAVPAMRERGWGRVAAGVIGDPADFGRIGAFVCSEHARYLTGTAIQVDGGAYGGLL